MRRAPLLCLLVSLPIAGPAFARGLRTEGTVNLNTAPETQLELLPGVGPAMAGRIVARRHVSAFRRPEDLRKVKGVGKKTYERLRPFVTVEGPNTLAVVGPPGGDAATTETASAVSKKERRSTQRPKARRRAESGAARRGTHWSERR